MAKKTDTTDEKHLSDLALINPTTEDIIALVVHLTVKRPSPEAIARGKTKLDAALAKYR